MRKRASYQLAKLRQKWLGIRLENINELKALIQERQHELNFYSEYYWAGKLATSAENRKKEIEAEIQEATKKLKVLKWGLGSQKLLLTAAENSNLPKATAISKSAKFFRRIKNFFRRK